MLYKNVISNSIYMNIIDSKLKKQYVIIRNFPLSSWKDIFDDMNYFTCSRNKNTIDEIWFLEHYPIYTQGYIDHNNIKYINNIPVISANRGGKITYHGPGQQVVYLLLDLKRLKMNIKKLLFLIEYVVLNTLYTYSIISKNIKTGIYVENKKICSIGLRIKNYCCFHGFALNVNMDLKPFTYINPCGDHTIIMTQICDIKKNISLQMIQKTLIQYFSLFFNIKVLSNIHSLNLRKI